MLETVKQKYIDGVTSLKAKLGLSNNNQVPKIVKVVVSSGTGKAKDKAKNDFVAGRLAKITGQKPSLRGAKKSIASFKLRQGDIIGVSVTLRGARMYGFLNKLINIALPRTRDFKGFDVKSIDEIGNLTVGIREHTIFPETADEELRDVFSLSVTIVTTARNREEAKLLLETIGFPFKKN